MAAWPGTLPQIPLVDGYSDSKANNVIATSMDSGPQKRRLRYTTAPRSINFRMYFDSAMVTAFDTFFTTTTHFGVDSFTFPLPPSGGSVSVHFTPNAPPSYSPRGVGVVCTISIEVDP